MNRNKISGSWSSLYIFSSFIPHSSSIILVYILLFPDTLLLSLLLSICFPLRFSAAGNGTYRLRPDGDDSQAVPAQDHHCWHQCLRPPHRLCPHQEGGQELSLHSLLFYLLLSVSLRAPGPLLLIVFLSFCYECQKDMNLIQAFSPKCHMQPLFSDTSHKSVQWLCG